MPDNQVVINPSNSHCSMSRPVQNLSLNVVSESKVVRRYRLTGDFSFVSEAMQWLHCAFTSSSHSTEK